MRRGPLRAVLSRSTRLRGGVPDDRVEAGDTLIEVLLALIVLGVASLAIMLALLTSISSSTEYRGLSAMDTVLRSVAGEATALVQQEPSAWWSDCGVGQTLTGFTLPTGYTVSSYTVESWNATTATYTTTCTPNASQLVTLTVSYNNTSASISTVLYDPLTRPVTVAGAAAKLVFLGQPGNGVVGAPLSPPPIIAIEDSAGNVVSTDLSPVQLVITAGSGTAGATISSNCSGTGFYGVITFSNCAISLTGSNFTLTASDGSLATATSSPFNVAALDASKFVIISPTVSGSASSSPTLGPITVQQQDLYGNAVNADSSGVTITLASSTSGTAVFSPTSGGAAVTSISIAPGSSTASFYYGDTAAGTPKITASEPGMASGSQTETVTAGSASQLAFAPAAPGPGTAGKSVPNVAVAVEDSFGNVVTNQNSGSVTLSVGAGSAQSSLTSGTATQNVTNGVATFPNLVVDTAGSYTFVASPTGVSGVSGSATSSAFSVGAASAAKLVVTSSAFITTANTVSAQPFTVALEDSFGNPTTSTSALSLQLSSTSTGALFATSSSGTPTTTATLAAGSSSLTLYYGDTKIGTPTLTIRSTGLSSATQTETVSATKFAITSNPFTTVANNSATQPFTIQLQLGSGAPATSATATTIHLTSTSPGGTFAASPGGSATTTVTLPANTSTVTVYYGDTKAGTPTVTVAATGVTSASQSESVTAAAPSTLVVSSSAFSVTASNQINQPFTVTLEDTFGNVTTSANPITVTLASTSTGALFADSALGSAATTMTLPANTSSVTGYYADTTAGSPTITAGATGLSAATQSETVLAGSGVQLVVTSQPASTITAGNSFSIGVSIEDVFGNIVTTSADSIALTLSTNSFASGTTTLSATNGVATFTGLKVNVAGTYTITATDTSTSNVPTVTTSPFSVQAAAGSKYVITSTAFSATASNSPTHALTVTLEDAFGNVAVSTGATLNLSSTSGGAVFATTSGGSPVTSASLPAGASTLTIFYGDTKAGTPLITVGSTGLSNGTQSETIVAGSGTQLVITSSAFTTTASNSATQAFVVTLEDLYGNPTTSSTATTLSLSSSSSAARFATSSGGSSVATATLPANTSSLTLYYGDTKAGGPTISASAPSLATASQLDTVKAAAGAKWIITSTPFTITATNAATQAVTVVLEDTYGNLATNATPISLALSSTSTGASFAATSNGSAVSAVTLPANTSSLTFFYADTKAGAPTITLMTTGLTSATQTESVQAGVGTKLAITSAAFSTTASTSPTQPFTVTLEDTYGNVATFSATTTVTLSSTSSAGVFATSPGGSAVISVTANTGSSSFTAYYGDTKAGAPTLSASATALGAATQSETVNAAAATRLIVSSGAFTSPATNAATNAVTLTLQDPYGNVATSTTATTVTLASTSSGAKFATTSGGVAVTSVTIPANTSSVTIYYGDTKVGTPTITATPSTLGATTQQETIVAGAASRLVMASSAFTLTASGSATQAVAVTIEDAYGNVAALTSATTVTLGSSSTGGRFATTPGGSAVASLSLPIGATGFTLYYGDTKAGSPILTFSASGLGTVNQTETIQAGVGTAFAFTSSPLSVTASTGATHAVTVSLVDAYGNVTSATSALSITLSSSSANGVFAATSGGAAITSITLGVGSSSVGVFYGDTKAGSPTLTGSDTGYGSGTQIETVTGAAPTSLSVGSIPFTATASNSPTNALTITLLDTFGNVTSTTTATTVHLTSTSTGGTFASTSGGAATTTVSIPANSSSLTLYYGDTKAGTPTLSFSATGLTGTSQQETIQAGVGHVLVVTSGGFAIKAGTAATQPFTVTLEDSYGNVATASATTTVTLSSTSTGGIFSATSGGGATTTVFLTTGSSSVTAYYADTKAGAPTIGAAGAGLTSATQVESVGAATGSQLVVTSSAFSAVASNSPTHAVTVTLEDAYGNVATASSATTLSLASSSTGGIFATSSGGAGVSSVTLASGASSVTFYYSDTKAGSPTLTVTATGLATGSQIETVTAGTGTRLVFSSTAFTITTSSSSTQPFTVTLEDSYGNVATAATSITVNLTSTSSGARFSATSGGFRATSVTITSGTSAITAYYGDSRTGTPTLTAAATGLLSGSQIETVS